MKLPPLNALRSFESAARTGSYVSAAVELGVTPAAVSQQVRNLEGFLGRTLFVRLNNRVVLTDAGKAIYAGTTPALQDIAAVAASIISGSAREKLVISVLPSLAECWFVPSFSEFAGAHPDVLIDLRVEDDHVDFAKQEIDLRLCYGADLYPDLKAVPLFRDSVMPMFAPRFAGVVSEMADELFIHTNWGPQFGSLPGWHDWCSKHAPARSIDPRKGQRVNASRLAIDFARHGLGVALCQWQLARTDVMAGRLRYDANTALQLGHDYCAVYPHIKSRKRGLLPLVDFLKSVSDQQTQTQHQ